MFGKSLWVEAPRSVVRQGQLNGFGEFRCRYVVDALRHGEGHQAGSGAKGATRGEACGAGVVDRASDNEGMTVGPLVPAESTLGKLLSDP